MHRTLDEQKLARLCAEQDRQAQEELYTRYAARLFTLCLRYSDSPDEAQDLLHDAFLKTFENISSYHYQGTGSLFAWICRIAINTALSNISRYKLRFQLLDISRPDPLPEPTDEAFSLISIEKLLEFISKLPDTQRAIFNMFCLDGYSHREIAAQLGISERGSTSMLAKAKNRLKKQINEYIKNSERNETSGRKNQG